MNVAATHLRRGDRIEGMTVADAQPRSGCPTHTWVEFYDRAPACVPWRPSEDDPRYGTSSTARARRERMGTRVPAHIRIVPNDLIIPNVTRNSHDDSLDDLDY